MREIPFLFKFFACRGVGKRYPVRRVMYAFVLSDGGIGGENGYLEAVFLNCSKACSRFFWAQETFFMAACSFSTAWYVRFFNA